MPSSEPDVVVAREAIVIAVGARPAEYAKIEVLNQRTGLREKILDTDNPPLDPGDEGTTSSSRPSG